MGAQEEEEMALALGATADAIAVALLGGLLPEGHAVVFVVVPRQRVVSTFVAGSVPHLDTDSTALALAQVANAMIGNEPVTLADLSERRKERRH